MLSPRFPGRQVLGSLREAKSSARRRIRGKLNLFLPQPQPMERRRSFATMVKAISTLENWDVASNWANEANQPITTFRLGRKNAESIAYRRDLARVGHATPNIGPELIITIALPEHSCAPYEARVRHQRSLL
jgi:hypothetical protein